ncbi:hypothetical protein AVEN_228673-1, partial [Araneus ventricosus]
FNKQCAGDSFGTKLTHSIPQNIFFKIAAFADISRIFIPILTSLSYLTAVRVAVPLFKEFGMEMLDKAFTDIQHGNPTASNEGSKEDRGFNYNRAKENLLLIPRHLRTNVLEVVHCMH